MAGQRSMLSERLMLFCWPVVKLAVLGNLDAMVQAVPTLTSELLSAKLQDEGKRLWDVQVASHNEKQKNPQPSLARLLKVMCRRELVQGCISGMLAGCLTACAKPLLLKWLVDAVADTNASTALLLGLVAMLAVELVLEGLFTATSKHDLLDIAGTKFIAVATALVLRKTGRISATHSRFEESGLIGNDVVRSFENLKIISLLPLALTSLLTGVGVLVYTLDWAAALVGLAVLTALILVNLKLGAMAKIAEEANLHSADKRLELMRQIIDGVRAIKLSAWETAFMELMWRARKDECVYLRRYRMLAIISCQVGRGSPIVGACATFVYLALTNPERLVASSIFAALNVFLALRLPLILLGETVPYMHACIVSFRRLDAFLLLPEAEEQQGQPLDKEVAVEMRDASFSWAPCPSIEAAGQTTMNEGRKGEKAASGNAEVETARGMTQLRNVSFTVRKGALVAVVGRVGSGKTCLVNAIIGEIPRVRGECLVDKDLQQDTGLVPQTAWIHSGTIQENILLGRPLDAQAFAACLGMSCLIGDVEEMPAGVNTEIGERGVTLSGGQKHRLSLARALYGNPSLLLVDDVLAAVDARVAQSIWKQAILERSKRCTCIMVLNQLHLVDQFDQVIFVDGGLVKFGTHDSLLANCKSYGNFVQGADSEDKPVQREETDGALAVGGAQHKLAAAAPIAHCIEEEELRAAAICPQSIDEAKQEALGGNTDDGKLVELERKETGGFHSSVISIYIRGMGIFWAILIAATAAACYTTMAYNDRWLAKWVDDALAFTQRHSNAESIAANTTQASGGIPKETFDHAHYAISYAVSSGLYFALLMLVSALATVGGVRSSKSLHNTCVDRILHAPISWFEENPSGRLLSRFSSDLSIVDRNVPQFGDHFVQFTCTIAALCALTIYLVPIMALIILLAGSFFALLVSATTKCNREVKREANNAMSPIQSLLSETIAGRVLLRAMGRNTFMQAKYIVATDRFSKFNFFSSSLVNWSTLASYVLSFIIGTGAAVSIVAFRDGYSPSEAALALTYSYLIPYFLLHYAFIISQVNSGLTSLERLLQYAHARIPQEPAWKLPKDDELGTWPSHGAIQFKNASFRYRAHLPPAVSGATALITGGQRIGIVGQTGAGKSSLVQMLFRAVQLEEGKILIDGVDTSSVGLMRLRNSMAVIPQDPLLIKGDVRSNLDPFSQRSELELQSALRDVGLPVSLLSAPIVPAASGKTGGSSAATRTPSSSADLSAGQRQLLNFARVLLNDKTKIVVCDEPTSNMDVRTDEAIQMVIRQKMKGKTVVQVAHRLNTIIDADKVMLMDAGRVIEFAPPAQLLADPSSRFFQLAKATGASSLLQLQAKAQAAVAAAALGVESDGRGKELSEVRLHLSARDLS